MEQMIRQTSTSPALHIQADSPCFVYRLPTETLEAIFIRCAHDYFSEYGGYPVPTAPSWVNVSYVSRLWRNVALNCATLWTYLFITSPRWTEELLTRSKQASLKLHMNTANLDKMHTWLHFAEQVMGSSHIQRTQELRLHLACHSGYRLLSKLSSPPHRLRHLSITLEYYPSQWSSLIFDGDTPVLRTLELVGCPTPWYSLKLSDLTTLSLTVVPVKFQQSTADFLTTLSRMQNLTDLYLDNALAGAASFLPSVAFHSFQKIDLPRLSRLWIGAPCSTVIALLSCINVPLKTEVRLKLGCGEHHPAFRDDHAPLCSLLAQRFAMSEDQTLSSPSINSLFIEFTAWGKAATITFGTSAFISSYSSTSVYDMNWGCNIPLQISLHFDQITISDRNRITSQICCPIPLSNVRRLYVIDPPLSSSFWTHVLGHLRGLRYISLSHGRMPNLAPILSLIPCDRSESVCGRADRDRGQMFAPELEKLELYDIAFMVRPAGDTVSLEHTDVQSLCDALSTRTGPRGRLTITWCLELGPDCRWSEERLYMTAWWEDGRLRTVDKAFSDTP